MNQKFKPKCVLAAWLLVAGCAAPSGPEQVTSLAALVADWPAIEGRAAYMESPYVTARDRVYMVGHQDGRFPDLGWHVEGEMGGIWDHPIKLMDGFVASFTEGASGAVHCLSDARQFVNYPLANKHVYEATGLRVERFQFVSDGVEGMVVEYTIENLSSEDRAYDYLKMLTNSFSYALPGSMYEVSSDYGMIAQAWNIYAVAVPIVQYFFGIHPRAYDRHITIRPRMPDGWDDAELENLPIDDNVITLEEETQGGTVSYTLHQSHGQWTIDLNLPHTDGVVVEVNGSAVEPEVAGDEMIVRLTGEHNEVRLVQP